MSETRKQNNRQGHSDLPAGAIYLITIGLAIAFMAQSLIGFLSNLPGGTN